METLQGEIQVTNFVNRFGPNTFPAFNSVIYSIEVQVAYIANVLFKPLLDGYADVVEVKHESEEQFIQDLDRVLDETVFSAGCSNWYINAAGRNAAAWPGLAVTFWHATRFPKWADFALTGGSSFWVAKKLWRNASTLSPALWLVPLAFGTWASQNRQLLSTEFVKVLSSVSR